MKIRFSSFLFSTFFGMIPSTVMYACWGKLLKKPSFWFYLAAAAILCLFITTTFLAQKHFYPWLKQMASENRRETGETR
jgi:uncharacterized membrane protein YdjX (TVP38/TMEM64 family)